MEPAQQSGALGRNDFRRLGDQIVLAPENRQFRMFTRSAGGHRVRLTERPPSGKVVRFGYVFVEMGIGFMPALNHVVRQSLR